MIINTRKQLRFCIMADRMINRGYFHPPLRRRLAAFVMPDRIMQFLYAMRMAQYWNIRKRALIGGGYLLNIYYRWRYTRLEMKLGFSICTTACDYALRIPHHGTIVIGNVEIGPYAALHTSTCIADFRSAIGSGLFLSTGTKITQPVQLGDNVMTAANSVVNRSFPSGNCLLVGTPAEKKRDQGAWYLRPGEKHAERYRKIEALRQQMGL